MRIYLIGFMGCGKSSFGKRLAKKLDYQFADLDDIIEEEANMRIPDIFSMKGEETFREIEKKALRGTGNLSKAVIATGGGTPCFHGNMDFMLENGVTVYLKMSPLSLGHRLELARRERPLVKGLKGDALSDVIMQKLSEREPQYMRAHCIIKGETVKPDQVISLVFGQ